MDPDNVLARAAASYLTAAQVAQRQRDMASSQIQSLDTRLRGVTRTTSTGTSGTGTMHPWRLNGIGAQFTVHSSGLSGERRGANHEKVCSEASYRNERLLTVNRSDIG